MLKWVGSGVVVVFGCSNTSQHGWCADLVIWLLLLLLLISSGDGNLKKYLFELPSKSEDEAATALDLTLLKDVSKFISYYKAGRLSPKMKRYSKKEYKCGLFIACLYTHIDHTFFFCIGLFAVNPYQHQTMGQ